MFVGAAPGSGHLSAEYTPVVYALQMKEGMKSAFRFGGEIEAFVFGETEYPLRVPTSLALTNGVIAFRALGLEGRGATWAEAFRDLSKAVHLEFQELEQKLPQDRTPDEQRRLTTFAAVLDVERYAEIRREVVRTIAKTLKKTREVGLLLQTEEGIEWFKWEDLPPEAAAINVGQFVLGTFIKKQGRLRECLDVIRLSNMDREITAEELERRTEVSDLPDDDSWAGMDNASR
jgi:hypothetical protein